MNKGAVFYSPFDRLNRQFSTENCRFLNDNAYFDTKVSWCILVHHSTILVQNRNLWCILGKTTLLIKISLLRIHLLYVDLLCSKD